MKYLARITSLNTPVSIDISDYKEIYACVVIGDVSMSPIKIPTEAIGDSWYVTTLSTFQDSNNYTYNLLHLNKTEAKITQADTVTSMGWTWAGILLYGVY